MDDEQGPWWTQPPEPRSDQGSTLRAEHVDEDDEPGEGDERDQLSEGEEPDSVRKPVIRRIGVIPDPPASTENGANGTTDSRPDPWADRRKPQAEAPTETLPAVPDDIFATFTSSDPDGIITGPIPSQPFGETQPSITLPPQSGAQPEQPRRTSPDPRTFLIGGAGVLVVAVIVLMAMLSSGGSGATANRTPNPVASKRTGAAAAAASFGGQVPSGLARVGSSQAAAILVKADQNGGGAVHEAWTWKDKNGTNLVVSTVKALPGNHAKLQVIHVAHVEGDSPKPLRIMTEPSLPTCRAGGAAQFTKDSLLVRDLNKDGEAEIAAGWSSHCGAEKSSEVKLALITGGKKYIIRGNGVIGGTSGSQDPDPKPSTWPDGFHPALQALFHKLYY